MKHAAWGRIKQCSFCPFEDFLGVGTARGWESIAVPGSGEPNIDSWVANPYSSRTQDQESEIKQLLDKVRMKLNGHQRDAAATRDDFP